MSGPCSRSDAGPRTADEHIRLPQLNFHEETLRPRLSLKQPETNTFLHKPGNQLGKKKETWRDSHGSRAPPAGNFKDYLPGWRVPSRPGVELVGLPDFTPPALQLLPVIPL